MTGIVPYSSQVPFNVATVNTLGGAQLATGGGHIAGPAAVKTAGSADNVATLYDGTSTSGTPLATFSLGSVGPAMMPNTNFATGLFIDVIGTTAGTVEIAYTGTTASP